MNEELRMTKRSIVQKLRDSKTFEDICTFSGITLFIVILLTVVGATILGLTGIGIFLLKQPNKLYFYLYVIGLVTVLIWVILYNSLSSNQKFKKFTDTMVKVGNMLATVLFIIFQIAVAVFIGSAIWQYCRLALILYVPFVLMVAIVEIGYNLFDY